MSCLLNANSLLLLSFYWKQICSAYAPKGLSVGCSVYVSDQHSSLLWSYSLIELFRAFRLYVSPDFGTAGR